MKRLIFLLALSAQMLSAQAPSGTETIDYTTSTGDKGSTTINQIRGTQNTGTVTNVTGSGTGGATVTVTLGTTTPNVAVALSAIPNASLANSSVTIAGQTVALGGTASISFTNLSGAATLAQLPTGIPNANLANSSVTIAGQTVALGGTATVGFSNLTGAATVAQLPTGIPNANLASSSVTVEGVSVALGGSYVAGSTTVTATGTDVIANKMTICNAGASDITRTLPASPPDGYTRWYKRANSTAGNTIIAPNAGQTLDSGNANLRLLAKDRTVGFQWIAAASQWAILD